MFIPIPRMIPVGYFSSPDSLSENAANFLAIDENVVGPFDLDFGHVVKALRAWAMETATNPA